MYITITPQKLTGNYSQSVTAFAEYLDKENDGKPLEEREAFFNQNRDQISRFEVIKDIDTNKKRVMLKDSKYYSITINPSAHELKAIGNNREALQAYTREIMKDYAASFNRNTPVKVDDIVYYAKLEHQRTFKYTEKKVKENLPYVQKLKQIERKAIRIREGKEVGNIDVLKKEYQNIFNKTPHKQNGYVIEKGMKKEGFQSHIHIIVSRKDRSNNYILSPDPQNKASTTVLRGVTYKRGFNKDVFREKAEERFDKMFDLKRNYVVSYKGRKELLVNPKRFFSQISGLPMSEKAVAYKFLAANNVPGISVISKLKGIPVTPVQLGQKGLDLIIKVGKEIVQSSSIGI